MLLLSNSSMITGQSIDRLGIKQNIKCTMDQNVIVPNVWRKKLEDKNQRDRVSLD